MTPEHPLQLAQARADLLAAETDLRNARAGGPPEEVAQLQGDFQQEQIEVTNLERTEKALEELVAKQAATQDELAQNQAALTKARAHLQRSAAKEGFGRAATVDVEAPGLRVSQAREQVQSLEEKVRSAIISFPVDGTLYSLPVHAGDYVKIGDVLAEMADLRHVQVRAYVDEPDLGWLEPSEDVQVTWDAKPGLTWAAAPSRSPSRSCRTERAASVKCFARWTTQTRTAAQHQRRSANHRSPAARGVGGSPGSGARRKWRVIMSMCLADDKIHRREVAVGGEQRI